MNAVEICCTGFQRPAYFSNAHVVVQYIHVAEASAGLGKKTYHVGIDGDISNKSAGNTAFGKDQCRGLLRRGGITVDDTHLRAQPRIGNARCASNTPARPRRSGAGDEDNAAR